jgi:ribosomal protein S18 acetylase RimI-like enzyme
LVRTQTSDGPASARDQPAEFPRAGTIEGTEWRCVRFVSRINPVSEFAVLDNPIWAALTTDHRSLARSSGRARRYPADVSPFAALETPAAGDFSDLSALVGLEEGVGFCTVDPIEVSAGWQVLKTRPLEQMVCASLEHSAVFSPLELGSADLPEMLALTAATEPGPFLPATIQVGRYFGIRAADGRLVAMAGERLKAEPFTEISAVCTDPEFRGRGHAQALVTFLTGLIFSDGRIPFLHVKAENEAKALYERLGFRVRRTMQLTVIGRL